MSAHVAWLHVAPIKSLQLQERARVTLGPNGIEEDRRFCVVDEEGRMLNAKRVEGVDRAGDDGHVSLLSQAALDALAEAAAADGPVDPRRFRMNIGIAGIAAHEEDGWRGRPVRIGEAVVVPGGNIGRCAVTTLDPVSGVSDLDTLAALARYRGAQVTTEPLAFGVWARVERLGTISLGDKISL